jgi:DHA1 family tetracycline resistance protein-like MFS transporter
MGSVSSGGQRRAAFAFIVVTVVVDILALGLTLPVLPHLIVDLNGGDAGRASIAVGTLAMAWALMQFVCAPISGMLSDRFGRRPVILLSNLGQAVDYAMIAIAPGMAWLLAARILSGAFSASFGVARAYIADVTPPEERAMRFSRLGIFHAFAFILGTGVGGMIGEADPRLVFWIASGLSVCNALYASFALPESLPESSRQRIDATRLNPLRGLDIFVADRRLRPFAVITSLNAIARTVLPTTLILYVGMRYGWSERSAGLMLAGMGAFNALVQGALVRPIVSRYGESTALLAGLAFGVAGLVMLGASASAAGFICGMAVMSLWGLSGPAAQGLMSRYARRGEQGRLQGSLSAIVSISECIGPALFTAAFMFAHARPFDSLWRGAPFLLSAAILCIAASVAARQLINAASRAARA